jgi:Ca-activated chloride channel family protein
MVLMGKIVFILMSLSVTLLAKAQDDQSLVAKGNELYKKQQFDKAAEQYRKAADLNTKNAIALYNLGDALYKSKKTDLAEKAFSDAANNSKDETAKSRALYNKGVTLSIQKKLLESIAAYKQALRLNSIDEEARQNLQKALNELKKQPQQNQQKQDNKKQDKQQNQKQPDQQKNNSKLNQQQVEQMLNALRKDEKKLQQDIQKKNNIGRSNSKDW